MAVLDRFYCTFCVFILPGVGGNLVAIQSSRISTCLHKASRPGNMPSSAVDGCPNCPNAFIGKRKYKPDCS